MKHIVLICHKDHIVSGSVNFIKNLFEKDFNIDVVTGNVSLQHIKSLFSIHSTSIFVLWQMEHLAPWFVSKGLKVVVFPMYDGCGTAPKSYFKVLDKTYLFNFSKKLHQICVDTGIVSHQLNYYPKAETSLKEKKSTLFYWLRRPDSSLSEAIITEVFSPYVENIHVHDRQDAYDMKKDVFRIPDNFISTSIWFDDKEDLRNLITTSKYYIAPRESEGIGMAFLEAMSLGCIVFANRNSTHDQYIYNGHNGFLIDFESRDLDLIKQQIKEAFDIINTGKDIGKNAREHIVKGRTLWEKQSIQILEMMNVIHDSETHIKKSFIEQSAGYLLVKLYNIHNKLYFIFTGVFLRLGLFNDKVLKLRLGMFYNLALRCLKLFKR